MKRLATVAAVLIAIPGLAFAHAGGLDKNGCHQNKAKKVYECHQGALKDQTFKSKSEAETAMKGARTGSAGKPAEQQAQTPGAKPR